jgi:hypothetical protein
MRHLVRIAAVVMAVAVMAAACSPGSEWTDRELQDAASTWMNLTGLNETDPDVWSGRLDRICEIGYAPGQAMQDMTQLAGEFITEDADVNIRADGSLPTAEEAVEPLLIIAQSPTCTD